VKLILHIGTHKTGTSSLQECLSRSERALADHGVYYLRLPRSTHGNGLAKLIAKGREAEVRAILNEHFNKAHGVGAKTLLVSAESFYAMTMFFHKLNGRDCDYWKSEGQAIELLCCTLSAHSTKQLVVFLRRQDRFLESIYRELVKAKETSVSINEFGIFFKEALDYWRHLQVWSSFFPDCCIFTYEEAATNTTDFFLRRVLNISELSQFGNLNYRLNTRLGRDVIEYKRMLNSMPMSSVERRMSKIACKEMATLVTDDTQYDDLLAPEAREALMRECDSGNMLLSRKFGATFPDLSEGPLKSWRAYPGLSPERLARLSKLHARIRRRTDYQIERWALFTRSLIKQRLPRLAWLIPLGRSLLPRPRRKRRRARATQ
jgi:hypothetical protein